MKKHYRHENNCLNCGTILEGKFCHNCGQENLEIKESFGHMMNHAISDYFHFDEKFFHTLKPLFSKPGLLTNEYMAGRRVQYLHPIKMYIFISLVYFLLFFQSGHQIVKVNKTVGKPAAVENKIDAENKLIAKNPNLSASQKKALQHIVTKHGAVEVKKLDDDDDTKSKNDYFFITTTGDTTYQQYETNQAKLNSDKRDGLFLKVYNKTALSYREKYGSRAREVFLDELNHNIPKMMFVLLPMFALILSITFSRNKKFYVEHLIYAFHLHCFLFLFLAILMLIQLIAPHQLAVIGWIDFAGTLYIIWYIYRSLKVVYQRSAFRTTTKIIGMSLAYLMSFAFCITIVVIITALISA
jgi:hypothetical protein